MDKEYDPYRHYFPELLEWEILLFNSGWKYVGSGRNRRVIRRGNVVIKLPYQPDGMKANADEAKLYRQFKSKPSNKNGAYYAPCRLLPNGCLMMRALKTKLTHKTIRNLPLWIWSLVDGTQVGLTKTGKVLAYDYADEEDIENGQDR